MTKIVFLVVFWVLVFNSNFMSTTYEFTIDKGGCFNGDSMR